jgi:hypothetical protein
VCDKLPPMMVTLWRSINALNFIDTPDYALFDRLTQAALESLNVQVGANALGLRDELIKILLSQGSSGLAGDGSIRLGGENGHRWRLAH